MVKKERETNEQQVNVRLTGLEYKALILMGGATAVIKSQIAKEAGDTFKLKQLLQQIDENIEKEQKQKQDILKLIKDYDEKTSKELRQKQVDLKKVELRNNNRNDKKPLSKEEWIAKWKPAFKTKIESGLCELEYEMIMKKMELKTKEEVDAWLRT